MLVCPQCGADVSYRQSFEQLAVLPSVTQAYEQISILFIGRRAFEVPGTYAGEVLLGDPSETTGKTLALRMIPGGNWLDYLRAYANELDSWLRLIAFGRSKYRVAIVDTTKLLSVLALTSIEADTIVIALTPGKESTPMEQNTSYVALRTALRRGLPVILASNHYVEELAIVKEGEGLLAGEAALDRIIGYFARWVRNIQDFVVTDSRLGIKVHSFSAIISASNNVYHSYDDLFVVQEYENSLESFPSEVVQSAYLLGEARKDDQVGIGQAFERYSSKRMPRLTSAQMVMRERTVQSQQQVYDIVLLFGVDESLLDDLLKEGYLSVAEKTGDLREEEVVLPR